MYERYNFKEKNGRIVKVNDYNSRVTYLKDNGRVAVVETLQARFRYAVYNCRPARTYRHYTGLTRMLRHIALR